MNRNLPNDIDQFFSDHLKNYAAEPGKDTWSEIDKRLSEKERQRLGVSKRIILYAFTAILICISLPFLLVDYSHNVHQITIKAAGNSKLSNEDTEKDKISTVIWGYKKTVPNNGSLNTQNIENSRFISRIRNVGLDIIETKSFITNERDVVIQEKLNSTQSLKFFEHDSTTKNKSGIIEQASGVKKPHKKNNLSISPFFSFDHITGRFIEQYEYDNDTKDDYKQREKADMSFTAGLLATYKFSKKFSLTSGFSFSNSNLSIASTAVNALKDENGVYQFKLATTYGLAEITKSGLIPSAGDSLLISSASLKLRCISLPILIGYNLNDRKIKLSVHAGIAVNKITSDKVEAEYMVHNNDELETINKIEGIKKTFFTLNAGITTGYPIKHNIDISLSPEIRYGINSINKGTPVKTYPINYGLSIYMDIKL